MITRKSAMDGVHFSRSIREYMGEGEYLFHCSLLPVAFGEAPPGVPFIVITGLPNGTGKLLLGLLCDNTRSVETEDFDWSSEKILTCPHCLELIDAMTLRDI